MAKIFAGKRNFKLTYSPRILNLAASTTAFASRLQWPLTSLTLCDMEWIIGLIDAREAAPKKRGRTISGMIRVLACTAAVLA